METRTKLLKVVPLAALFWIATAPNARAEVLGSSMTVQCIGTACTQLRFVLDVSTTLGQNNQLYQVTITNSNTANWTFTGVASVESWDGTTFNPVTGWSPTVGSASADVQFATGSGAAASEPLRIVVDVTPTPTTGTPQDYLVGSFGYSANGCEGTTDCATLFTTSGQVTLPPGGATTVTPEPKTLVLLTLGLTLLGGLALTRATA